MATERMTSMTSADGDKMETETNDKMSTGTGRSTGTGSDKPQGDPPWLEEYLRARDASMPVREMPPKEEMEYTLKEEDVGITEYLAAELEGFEAIIKHRFSDFNVNEIDRAGNVTRLKSMKLPEEKPVAANADVDAGKWPKHSELTADEQKGVSSLQWIRVLELAKKTLMQDKPADGDTVTIDITTKEKPERKVIHELIRKVFKHLETNIMEKDGKKHIAVSKKKKVGLTKAGRPEWPRERPKYLHFTMYKEDQDTAFVLNAMARALQKDKKGFGIAGTKDKRARTSQRVSIAFVTPKSIARSMQQVRQSDRKSKGWKARRGMVLNAGDYTFEKEGLNLGDLSGNRFTIILRNCVSDADGVIDPALSSLKEKGFVNYFGLQRFGTAAVKTSDVGLAMIKEKWGEAVDLILKPRANEKYQLALCRRIWWQFRDAHMAHKVLGYAAGHTIEGKLLFGMKSTKQKSYVSALNMIPLNQRLMYLHSYQSLIWNRVVSRRLKEFGTKVLVGDLFIDETKPVDVVEKDENEETNAEETKAEEPKAEEPKVEEPKAEKPKAEEPKTEEETTEEISKGQIGVVTEGNLESISIYDVVMPMPGSKIVYPDNGTRRFYQEELEADGLNMDPSTFINKSDPPCSLGGSYRKMISKPKDMRWRHLKYSDPNGDLAISDVERLDGKPEVESEADGAYHGLVVEFNLKSSTYATMALREALKSGTGKLWQTELTAKHMREHREKIAAEKTEEDDAANDAASGTATDAATDGEPEAKKAKLAES